MASERSGFEPLLAAVMDGAAANWADFLDRAATDDERRVIEQLRVLAAIAQATAAQPPTAMPRHWGPFELLEEIGTGHFGRVFRAREPRLDREVAIKLTDQVSSDTSGTFVREAQLLARVRHPNVVIIYGADVFDGQAGLWMELIRGRSLDSLLHHQGPFGPREVALLGIDLCSALSAVHAAGLTHRDVKAQNVMREFGGRLVLMDFGAGQWTVDGTIEVEQGATGTPLYMAPELFDGAPASVSTDLYSVGVLLFLLSSGEYPVRGRTIAEIRRAHRENIRCLMREARADLPAAFAQVVDRALAPDPHERFRSAAELQKALASTLDIQVRPAFEHAVGDVGKGPTLGPARRLPAWATALVIVVALVLGAALQAWLGVMRPDQPGAVMNTQVGMPALKAEQWDLLSGYQELAGSLADEGRWARAADEYLKASKLLLAAGKDDEPQRAHIMGSLGWALLKAGRLDAAKTNFDLALYKLTQEAGDSHSLIATLVMASACERYARGDLLSAADTVLRAIAARRRTLGVAGIASEPRGSLDRDRLIDALAEYAPDADADADWIPDAIETAVGLDPRRADSDGNGVSDGEEDIDGDGVTNANEWAIAADPSHVLTHFGGVEPERLGYRRERTFEGQAAPQGGSGTPAWRVDADVMGFYFHKLTSAQKRAATSRGFRLLSRTALSQGLAFVVVDLVPLGARIDQNFTVRTGRSGVELLTKAMPREGARIDSGPSGRPVTVDYVYDPSTSAASVFLDGRRVSSAYPGLHQYQEDFGLFWGTSDDIGRAPRGIADFSLILLQIR